MEKKNKLGYTWYPKDWGNSEKVFELNLSERGLYRELIDMAMLNDNKTQINYKVWSRKFGCSVEELQNILLRLKELELLQINNDDFVFIPSCEARLNLVRGGSNGGKKSKKNKPILKPNDKPFVSLGEKNDKPTHNQIENKEKEKETKKEILNSVSWYEQIGMKRNIMPDRIKLYLGTFLDCQEDLIGEGNGLNRESEEIKNHFVKWLDLEIKKEIPTKEAEKNKKAPDLDWFRSTEEIIKLERKQ
jgi:hypothetical protein